VKPKSIGIAGAGIGGLSAALCLHQNGARVFVAEAASELREAGAGIQISPNASRILIGLGLGEKLEAAAIRPAGLAVHRFETGEILAESAMHEHGGAPFYCIRRADLQRILAEELARQGVPLLLGQRVSEIRQDADGASLVCGPEIAMHADGMIAADGLHSSLRSRSSAKPRFTGFIAHRAIIAAAHVPALFQAPMVRLWLGHGRHLVTYPVAGGQLVNLVLITGGQSDEPGWDFADAAETARRLLKQAAPQLQPLAEIPADWRFWPLYDAPPARMAEGRVALLGDAAHPVLPFLAQGAALAIEDAAALATLLAEAPVPQAFGLYRQLREARARRVQREARANGRIYHLPWPLSIARDAAIRLNSKTLIARYSWLYEFDSESAAKALLNKALFSKADAP
jgi:salicylate hydroxylase